MNENGNKIQVTLVAHWSDRLGNVSFTLINDQLVYVYQQRGDEDCGSGEYAKGVVKGIKAVDSQIDLQVRYLTIENHEDLDEPETAKLDQETKIDGFLRTLIGSGQVEDLKLPIQMSAEIMQMIEDFLAPQPITT